MQTPEPFGLPRAIERHPDIDEMGPNCRISERVTVMRGARKPDRGIWLGADCVLLRDVRLVIGDLEENPDADLRLGDRTVVNVGCYLSGEGGLVLDEDVLVGAHVKLLSAGHAFDGFDAVIARNPLTYGRIHIHRGAWISAGAIVLQGVEIGQGAVVGAGAVVTKSVPPFAIAVGNPARVLRYRDGFADVHRVDEFGGTR